MIKYVIRKIMTLFVMINKREMMDIATKYIKNSSQTFLIGWLKYDPTCFP